MTRTVSGAIQTGLDAWVTEPAYLVFMDTSPASYLSTRGAVSWNGDNWIQAGARVSGVSDAGATIEIDNSDNSASALLLNNATIDKQVIIYQHYNGDAVEIFRGHMADADINKMSATIQAAATPRDRARFPRLRVAPPLFTKLPAPGRVIRWGNTEITIE